MTSLHKNPIWRLVLGLAAKLLEVSQWLRHVRLVTRASLLHPRVH